MLRSNFESVALEYQILDPGKYIPLADRAYRSNWRLLPMEKSAGENRYEVQVPSDAQLHRRLIRYRFKLNEASGNSVFHPPQASSDPNYAYFVYDAIPAWKAAIEPGSNDPGRSEAKNFSSAVMSQVQTYFLIAKQKEVENATWHERSSDKEYRYTGALVANGRVYDHVRFRARGGVWRHAMGKNMWKFDFQKSNRLQPFDDYGRPYKSSWGKLNLRACIQQGDYGRRGEQGMYEAVGFRLFNLVGVDSPRTHWISLRIIDATEEQPADQYQGDFWGLYLAIENEDGRFLEEHALPDGNVYKMMFGQGELANQGRGQPSDGSDLRQLISAYRSNISESWWRKNVDLPRYYSYRSIVEAIHHYDISDGKNYTFYRNPRTSQWCVIPWDIDLSWGDHMYGGGHEPFMRILSRPGFRLEYQNRLREIRDLLFNPDETGRLIDECASIIWRSRGSSLVDADRAKWDFHPIMESRYVLRGKAEQGLFYQSARTRDFAGMVKQMKDYITRRANFIDRSLIADKAIPETPSISYSGAEKYPIDAISFTSTPFAGAGQFAAIKWRVAQVGPHPDLASSPAQPGHYEITPTWESPELVSFQDKFDLPPKILKPAQTYRARVRLKDDSGRWSHWSAPLQFTTAR